MGLPIFVGLRGMDISTLRVHVQAYRRAWREAGHPGAGNVYLRIPVYAGATEKGALEEGRTGAGPTERLQARSGSRSAPLLD